MQNSPQSRTRRSSVRRIATALAGSWLACAGLLLATVVVFAQSPALHIVGPTHVTVGEAFEINVQLEAVDGLAAYEVQLGYDRTAAHARDVIQQGLAAGAVLGPNETANGIAFGGYACAASVCPADMRSAALVDAGQDRFTLATAVMVADAPGTLQIDLARAQFVDRNGNVVDVAGPLPSLTIVVEPADGQPRAAAAPLDRAVALAAVPGAALQVSPDRTGDGRFTYADLLDVEMAWAFAQRQGRSCTAQGVAGQDLNGDGCVSIADIALLARATELEEVELDLSGVLSANRPRAAASATFTVNTTGDGPDSFIGDGICLTQAGSCSLRAAIQEANASEGPDTIVFAIPGDGVQTIQLGGMLPALSDETGGTLIDGYSQPGASPNTDAAASNAVIMIQIKGQGSGEDSFNGLRITSAGNQVQGLAFFDFFNAIWLFGPTATDNHIVGNFIGTDAAATFAATEPVFLATGILIEQQATDNWIGGPTAAERNVLAGNAFNGLSLFHDGTSRNRVQNNLIGLAPAGDRALSNQRHGLDINFGASSNLIGGDSEMERNVISANAYAGVEISHGAGLRQNQIVGNFFGTDVTGTQVFSGSGNLIGVRIWDLPSETVVISNVIGSSIETGILIEENALNNVVQGNRIGVALDDTPIPNAGYGIRLQNQVTGTLIGPDNIIAYNGVGIDILGDASFFNTITRNSIYTNDGLGIDLAPAGPNPPSPGSDTGPNQLLDAPVITDATPQQITGTACISCTVEVFVSDSVVGSGEGKTFVTADMADASGVFTISLSGLADTDTIVATATDPAGNTSEFSIAYAFVDIYEVTIATAGSGSGSVSLDPPGGIYTEGMVVTATATPNAGSTFSGWSGDCAGMDACVLTIDGDKQITATFDLASQEIYLPMLSK